MSKIKKIIKAAISNSRILMIIVAALVLAILVSSIFVLNSIDKDGGKNSSGNQSGSASSETVDMFGYIPIFEFDNNQIRNCVVENKNGGYEVKYVKKDTYEINGVEGYELNKENFDQLLQSCMLFAATKTIAENPEDLAPYGLDDPVCSVKNTYDTGEVYEFSVGDVTPDGSGNYVYLKNTNKIYHVQAGWSTVFESKYTFFIDMSIADATTTDENGNEVDPVVKKISYYGPSLKYPIVLEKNPEYDAELDRLQNTDEQSVSVNVSQYIFTSPFVADASNDTYSGLQDSYFGLAATDIAVLKPTSADFAKYGLNKPQLTIEIVMPYETLKINLGNSFKAGDDKFYYATSTQREAIYIVSAEDFSFHEQDMIDYMSALVVNVMIDDIETMTIEHGDKTYKFELTGKGDDLVVRWDGKKTSTLEFRDLYQLVMLVYCEQSVEPGQYSGDAELKITYTYHDREKVDVVEYIPAEVRKYLIRRNGSDLALVRSKYVDTLIFGIGEYIAGRDVPSDY